VAGSFDTLLMQVLDIVHNELDDQMPLLQFPLWDSMSQLVIASWIHRETAHLVSAEEIKQAQRIDNRTSF